MSATIEYEPGHWAKKAAELARENARLIEQIATLTAEREVNLRRIAELEAMLK